MKEVSIGKRNRWCLACCNHIPNVDEIHWQACSILSIVSELELYMGANVLAFKVGTLHRKYGEDEEAEY